MKTYRKKWYDRFNECDKTFEVHHIDFDRNNNDLNNLVAIPKILHSEYHLTINILKEINDHNYDPVSFIVCDYENRIKKIRRVSEIIFNCIRARDFLLKHNIKHPTYFKNYDKLFGE